MSTRNSRSFTHRSRERIIAAKIVNRLIKFANREIEMTRQQTQVGMKLVDKVLPTLKSVSIEEIEPRQKFPREMTDEELFLEIYRSPGGAEMFHEVLSKWRSEFVREISA